MRLDVGMKNRRASERVQLSRTQWLQVAQIGLIGWLGGVALDAPGFAIGGFLALLVAVVGALFTERKG